MPPPSTNPRRLGVNQDPLAVPVRRLPPMQAAPGADAGAGEAKLFLEPCNASLPRQQWKVSADAVEAAVRLTPAPANRLFRARG